MSSLENGRVLRLLWEETRIELSVRVAPVLRQAKVSRQRIRGQLWEHHLAAAIDMTTFEIGRARV